jgi:hypothetical protein
MMIIIIIGTLSSYGETEDREGFTRFEKNGPIKTVTP